MIKKISLLLSAAFCIACTSLDVHKALNDVETYIMERPDSALAVLDSMGRSILSSERDKAHHALLYAMALDKNFIDVNDDSIARVAVDYYSKHGPDRHYARSLYYLGVAYYYQGAYDKAILEFSKAEEIAKGCDSLYWGMTKSVQALVYDQTYNNKEELNCLREAYRIYEGIFDSYKMQSVTLRMAMCYSSIRDYEEAEKYYLALLDFSDIDPLIESYALSGYAFMKVVRSDFHTALNIYDSLINRDSNAMADQDYWAYSYALCASGRQKDADELISNLDKETSDALYWQYRIYKKRGNIDKALDFLEKSNLSDNEIIRESLSQSLALAQRNYYESQYELSEYKAKNRSKTIVIIITLSLLLILLVLWVASRHIKSQREEKERYLQYADEITRQLEKAKKDDYPSLKKKYLDLYKTRFETIGAIYEQYSLSSGKDNAEYLMYEKIVSMVSDFRKNFSDKEELEAMLNADIDNIILHLRTEVPRIKQVDVSMFCYFAIGFDVTTISHLMNVSMNTIYIRKSRLSQRIEELSSDHREQFLQILCEKKLSKP